jgi:hypothetical protein
MIDFDTFEHIRTTLLNDGYKSSNAGAYYCLDGKTFYKSVYFGDEYVSFIMLDLSSHEKVVHITTPTTIFYKTLLEFERQCEMYTTTALFSHGK